MATCTIETPLVAPANAAAATIDHRYGALVAFDAACQRQAEAWLGPRERVELANWHDPRRRRVWLMGRMLGKQLVAASLRSIGESPHPDLFREQSGFSDGTLAGTRPWESIEIISLNGDGRSTRPRIWRAGVEQVWSLSISHTGQGVLAALCTQAGVSIGVDVAAAKTFSAGFLRMWFTPAEQEWIRNPENRAIAPYIWAAKEAVYKACNAGEGFAPREIEILPDGACSYPRIPSQAIRLRSWNIDSQIVVLATAVVEGNIISSRSSTNR